MIKYNVTGMPAGLPVGTKCQTRAVSTTGSFATGDFTVHLEYVGPYDPDNPCLFPVTITAEDYKV
jgi:hypothetical protein